MTRSRAKSTHLGAAGGDGWLDAAGGAGYVAKGVVYGVVGVLALQTAFGVGGSTEGSEGAIREIAQQPFGTILLIVLSLGLVAYVLLRTMQAFLDTERKGSDASGLLSRAGYLGSAASYALLALLSLRIVFGGGGGGESGSRESITAIVLASPFGRLAVAAAGLGVIAVGAYQVYRIWSGKYMDRYDTAEMDEKTHRLARRAGQVGLTARGVVFALLGIFVIQAAVRNDASETKGLGEALGSLANQPYGPYLLAVVATGLVCYAVYCFFRARYRRFEG